MKANEYCNYIRRLPIDIHTCYLQLQQPTTTTQPLQKKTQTAKKDTAHTSIIVVRLHVRTLLNHTDIVILLLD